MANLDNLTSCYPLKKSIKTHNRRIEVNEGSTNSNYLINEWGFALVLTC